MLDAIESFIVSNNLHIAADYVAAMAMFVYLGVAIAVVLGALAYWFLPPPPEEKKKI
jgi:hypothetical protein